MNVREEKAADQLRKAMDSCHEAGLRGGVYECSMRVWPINADPDPHESGLKFFEVINKVGKTICSEMIVDGGAGI